MKRLQTHSFGKGPQRLEFTRNAFYSFSGRVASKTSVEDTDRFAGKETTFTFAFKNTKYRSAEPRDLEASPFLCKFSEFQRLSALGIYIPLWGSAARQAIIGMARDRLLLSSRLVIIAVEPFIT
jgi:hypothetical protein